MDRTDPDGIPYTIAEKAEVRGRRLYLDGEPFQWATSGDIDLQIIRTGALTTILVPIAVMGPVSVDQKLYGYHQNAHTDLPTVACREDGTPVQVFVDGHWRRLADEEKDGEAQ